MAADVGTADAVIKVNDASGMSTSTYYEIDGEEIYVTNISGNDLNVERGKDGTTIGSHLVGDPVKSITSADADLIPEGDDFGFDGTTTGWHVAVSYTHLTLPTKRIV